MNMFLAFKFKGNIEDADSFAENRKLIDFRDRTSTPILTSCVTLDLNLFEP